MAFITHCGLSSYFTSNLSIKLTRLWLHFIKMQYICTSIYACCFFDIFFSVSYSNFLHTFKLCWSFFRQSFSYANLVLAEFPEKNTALCAFIHHRRQRPSLQSGVIDMVATEAWLAGKIFFLFHHVRGVSCFWHRFHAVMWFRFRFRDKKKKKKIHEGWIAHFEYWIQSRSTNAMSESVQI